MAGLIGIAGVMQGRGVSGQGQRSGAGRTDRWRRAAGVLRAFERTVLQRGRSLHTLATLASTRKPSRSRPSCPATGRRSCPYQESGGPRKLAGFQAVGGAPTLSMRGSLAPRGASRQPGWAEVEQVFEVSLVLARSPGTSDVAV